MGLLKMKRNQKQAKVEMNRRGLSMCASAELHPPQKGMINVNRRRIGSLTREINFEIFKQG